MALNAQSHVFKSFVHAIRGWKSGKGKEKKKDLNIWLVFFFGLLMYHERKREIRNNKKITHLAQNGETDQRIRPSS